MTKNEIIQRLLKLGWEPIAYLKLDWERIAYSHQDDEDFHLWKQFEISKSNELKKYTDYVPRQDEKIFLVYEIYPNRKVAMWYMWRENDDQINTIWEYDDYDVTLELALQDMLFTYPQQGCKTCKHNRPRTLKDKTCKKGYKCLFGPCKDYERKGE